MNQRRVILRMNELPALVVIQDEQGKREKVYQLAPAGKLGACLNRASEVVASWWRRTARR